MKALALDTAISCITLSAKNEENTATVSLDIGMHQSERLLPSIEYIMKECDLEPRSLDYIAISKGPGSFTGLRLGFAAAKALNFVTDCPVFGISTLQAYAQPFVNWPGKVISAIDAKKERFFSAIYQSGVPQTEELDAEPEMIAKLVDNFQDDSFLVVGPDSFSLHEILVKTCKNQNIYTFEMQINPTLSLFQLGEKMLKGNAEPLADFDGPVYIRKSEAEEKNEN